MKIKYPSVIDDMTNEDYHTGVGDEAIGSSSLKTLATKTPNHFKNRPPQESKPYFDKGTASHIAILEPEKFKKLVIRGGKDRRQKEYKEAIANWWAYDVGVFGKYVDEDTTKTELNSFETKKRERE